MLLYYSTCLYDIRLRLGDRLFVLLSIVTNILEAEIAVNLQIVWLNWNHRSSDQSFLMSSRALRKLQRELEQQQRQAVLKENEEESEESEEDDYSVATKKGSTLQKNNAFDLLNEASDTEMAPEDEEDSASVESRSDRKPARTVTQAENIDPTSKNEHKSHAKRRPKKAKRKQQPNNNRDGSNQDPNPKPDTGKAKLDEIDLALLSLKESNAEPKDRTDDRPDERFQRLYELLATDIKYLNALNEMRRLFGGAVLESESGNARVQDTGRRHRGPHQLDLGGALAGRNNPVSRGRGLAGLALRRNIFMLGKEEWPKATSGGLGMEIVEKAWDLTTEYCFVHNPTYRDVQRQFSICVESLDPERMVQLLQFNRKTPLMLESHKQNSFFHYSLSYIDSPSSV